jgi:drug/metabolite transporter (DMT)-like permease
MGTVLPLGIVIVSGIVSPLAQKSSGAARPWPMLMVAYGAAFVIAAVLAVASGGDGARAQPGRERSAGLLLGLAAFGIEAGFFYVYRAGARLAGASVIANVVVTATLCVLGIVVYRESLTATRAAGLAFAATGAALIARGGA